MESRGIRAESAASWCFTRTVWVPGSVMAGYFPKLSCSVRKSTLRLVGVSNGWHFPKDIPKRAPTLHHSLPLQICPLTAARSQEKSSCTLENLGYIYRCAQFTAWFIR